MNKMIDLAIIGGGIAGVSAAITAAQRGLKVKIFDRGRILQIKDPQLYLNAVDPLRQQNQKIQDSTELFFRQTISYGEYRGFPDLVRKLCYTSPNTIQWLEELSVKIPSRVIRVPEGLGPRTHLLETKNLTEALLKRLEFLKIEVSEGTEVAEILASKNAEWGIKDSDGQTENFRNVLLAVGQRSIGELFEGAKHSGPPLLSSLLKINAAFAGLSFIQYEPIDAFTRLFLSNPADYILVDGSGKRFIREDADKRILYDRIAATAQPVTCIRFRKAPATAESLVSYVSKKSSEFRKELEETIKAFNTSVEAKQDYLEDSRDPDSFTDKISFEKAFCHPIFLKPSAYLGGIAVDNQMNIITWNGETLKGLYACGGVLGGVHGRRAVKGNELLASLVFGRFAGSCIPINS